MINWTQSEFPESWILETSFTPAVTIGRWDNEDEHKGQWYTFGDSGYQPRFLPSDLTVEQVKEVVQLGLASILRALASQLSS